MRRLTAEEEEPEDGIATVTGTWRETRTGSRMLPVGGGDTQAVLLCHFIVLIDLPFF